MQRNLYINYQKKTRENQNQATPQFWAGFLQNWDTEEFQSDTEAVLSTQYSGTCPVGKKFCIAATGCVRSREGCWCWRALCVPWRFRQGPQMWPGRVCGAWPRLTPCLAGHWGLSRGNSGNPSDLPTSAAQALPDCCCCWLRAKYRCCQGSGQGSTPRIPKQLHPGCSCGLSYPSAFPVWDQSLPHISADETKAHPVWDQSPPHTCADETKAHPVWDQSLPHTSADETQSPPSMGPEPSPHLRRWNPKPTQYGTRAFPIVLKMKPKAHSAVFIPSCPSKH